MFLTITLYEHEGQDRFSVKLVDPDKLMADPIDVTDQYEIGPIEDGDTGQMGFVVMPKKIASIADDAGRDHDNGKEL